MADNQFTGRIRHELGQLPNLQVLLLGANNLTGGISGTLLNCSSLQFLDLGFNMLGNTLPSDIGDVLPNLQLLYLDSNNFEGSIPASLGNVSGLEELDFSYNNFTGEVPSSLGKYGALYYLNLQTNKFEANDSHGWEFIDTLSNFSSLETLVLGQNQFQGPIPNSIGKLSTSLKQLGLGRNNFTGAVPNSIGNLTGLTVLELCYNNLNGPVEGWLRAMRNLEGLVINANNFIGPVPFSIGNLTKLSLLLLEENKFEGLMPSSLGNIPMLTRLNFSYNNLYGKIPREIFYKGSTLTRCALSYNNLEGPVPPEIGNLIQLTELQFSCNKLTGEIPTALGNCEELQIMEMDHNYISGTIPTFLSYLTSLTLLNMSHNNLSGFIPIELGDLQHLTQLDLSYNNLQGEVPKIGVFGNAKSVSLLSNSGLCGGVWDLHMPPCSTVSRSKETLYYLIRVLIPLFGIMSSILLIYAIIPQKKKSATGYSSLFSFGKKFPRVSYKDLAQATENFSEFNLIGRGSYGSVYRGKLTQAKMQVAIKVFDLEMRFADKSFVSECEVLRRIRHRNLLSILTACSTMDNREYGQSVHASTSGDVYSFGIVLLEMLVGKRPTDSMFEGELNIVNFVERNFPDQMLSIFDSHLQEECKCFIQPTAETENEVHQCLLSLVQLALSCTRLLPRERMSMREIAVNLHAIRRSYVGVIKREQVIMHR
ncbi:unnamed protein product [Urochloa humidicola]